MTDQVKLLIAERNGVDLDDVSELSLDAVNTYLDSVEFSQDNVKDALESLVLSTLSTFSLTRIFRDITIQDYSQMVVLQEFCVDPGVELTILGEVAVI